ncbi:hypothetical protein LTR50_003701 [Elasticomyces elasticus]|nr:hypothetical protein LTR50_003701 [Elasticomyces elasticus]
MPYSNTGALFEIIPLHPTFAAEIKGVDFSQPVPEVVFAQIKAAIAKYGVCVFRDTGLDDVRHVSFAAQFGELDDVTPYTQQGKKHRLQFIELFDVSNLNEDGTVAELDSHRAAMNKGNTLFHVDSSFNPRRGSYSLLRAHELPPRGTGGNTEYADTRQAFEDLSPALKRELLENDYIACHSLMHSRKKASPDILRHIDPTEHPMSRHRLVQRHEPSGRLNLYIASHVHHIEGVSAERSEELIDELYAHACRPEYTVSLEWLNDSDLFLWDNTCVMHRAVGGAFEGKYKRDMRRATVHDSSSHAWGMNEKSATRQGYP